MKIWLLATSLTMGILNLETDRWEGGAAPTATVLSNNFKFLGSEFGDDSNFPIMGRCKTIL